LTSTENSAKYFIPPGSPPSYTPPGYIIIVQADEDFKSLLEGENLLEGKKHLLGIKQTTTALFRAT